MDYPPDLELEDQSLSLPAPTSVFEMRLVMRLVGLSVLALSTPAGPNCCCSKGSAPYWSNPPFLIFDIRVLWRSVLSARGSECKKIKNGGLDQYGKV